MWYETFSRQILSCGRYEEYRRGFTLIETLVAVSLLTVAIVAPMTLTTRSLSAAYYARDQITAFHLAQEAVESVRNVRDGNILTNALGGSVDLLSGIPSITGQPFTVDTRNGSMEQCPVTCPPLKTDGELYGYENGSPWVATRFTRTVRAEPVSGNADEVRVSVTVSWRSGSFQTRTFTISENLYRWIADSSVAGGGDESSAGNAITFDRPGQHTFLVPEYATNLTVKLWGAGAGGGSESSGSAGDGDTGGNTSITVAGATRTAGGGQGGRGGYSGGGQGGAGGTATGGTVNTPGNPGVNTTSAAGGAGGSAPAGGGAGGAGGNNAIGQSGSAPGAGGGGGDEGSGTVHGGGGGSGGYVSRVYSAGSLSTGSQMAVVVGAGGLGGTGGGAGGVGAAGRVEITWE